MPSTFRALPLALAVAFLVLTAAGAQAAPIDPEKAAEDPGSVVDPTDPTKFRVDGHRWGPVETLVVNGSILHDHSQAGLIAEEELVVRPTTQNGDLDDLAHEHTDGTLAGEIVWTLELDHQGEVSVLVPLR